MRYCEQCGQAVQEGDFCTNCGSRLEIQPLQPVHYCRQCGQILEDGAFCTYCGAKQDPAQYLQEEITGWEEEQPRKRGGAIALILVLLCLIGGCCGFLAWRLIGEVPEKQQERLEADEDEEEEEEKETEEKETEEKETEEKETEEKETEEESSRTEETEQTRDTGETEASAPTEQTSASEETQPPTEETQNHAQLEQTEPEEVLTAVSLSSDGQYAINIFLSNFSEQGFHLAASGDFVSENSNAGEILEFIFTYKQINTSTLSGRQNSSGEVYLTLDEVNELAVRFFGRSLTGKEAEEAGFRVSGQKIYWTPAEDGSHNYMTVANQVWQKEDGTYLVEFTVYSVGGKYCTNGVITDKNVYYLTPDNASGNAELTVCLSGIAEVSAYKYNGRNTYQLIRYTVIESP